MQETKRNLNSTVLSDRTELFQKSLHYKNSTDYLKYSSFHSGNESETQQSGKLLNFNGLCQIKCTFCEITQKKVSTVNIRIRKGFIMNVFESVINIIIGTFLNEAECSPVTYLLNILKPDCKIFCRAKI